MPFFDLPSTKGRRLGTLKPTTSAPKRKDVYKRQNAVSVVHHLHKDESTVAAVSLVHVQNRMGSGAGTGEGVEKDVYKRQSRNCTDVLYTL